MPTDRRRVLGAALVLPLAACLPMPYGSYYRPSAVDAPARRKRGWCQGQAGPETVLELDAPLPLTARIDLGAGRPPGPLRVDFVVAAGRTLQFLGDEVRLVDAGGVASAIRPSLSVQRRFDVAPGSAPVTEALAPLAASAPGATVVLMADAPGGFAPPSLRLRGPQVQLDGRTVAPVFVELARPEGDGLLRYRSADRVRQLEARTADCRRDTPQRACDNLLRYDDLSFEQRDQDGGWRGSVSVFSSRGAQRPLRVELALAAPQARSWRLVDPSATLEETGSRRRETVSFASMALRFEQAGPLSSTVRATPAGQPAETSGRLELPLPDGLQRFDVQLPAARIDGHAASFPTLRFERRSFDGGFEAFNC